MKTKHAREIRKGITFARQLHAAGETLYSTSLEDYYIVWHFQWLQTASTLAKRAFREHFYHLEARSFLRTWLYLNQFKPDTGQAAT